MNHLFYDSTGEIVGWVKLATLDSPIHIPQGTAVLAGTGRNPTHYVADGRLFVYSPEVVLRKAQKPRHPVAWSNETMQWEDIRSFEELKVAKNSEINAARAKANATSFTYLGKEIACDRLSRSDIDAVSGEVALTGSLPASWPGAWKAKDNSYVPIPDVATWTAFYKAMTAQGTANFVYSQTLKARVALASTIVEVEAVNW